MYTFLNREIKDRDPQVSEDQKDTLEIIHKSGNQLLGLLNNVLEIAKIETGRIALLCRH